MWKTLLQWLWTMLIIWIVKVSRGSAATKLNIQKAFDFLLQVLYNCGFSFLLSFMLKIENIFDSARILILNHGIAKVYFSCSRGLRQGDLLSPFLF